MKIYFKTRELARKHKGGKFIDNGASAEKGKRFAREYLRNVSK